MRYITLLNKIDSYKEIDVKKSNKEYHVYDSKIYDICMAYSKLYDENESIRKNYRKIVVFTHPFETINKELSFKSLGGKKAKITNAFMKMMEFLWMKEIKFDGDIKMFDIAGAPGMFILATEYFCERCGKKFDWQTCSLEGGTALEDSYGLFKNNMDRYIACDVLKNEDVEKVYEKVGKGEFNLVTGDIGAFHDDNYGELQEIGHLDLQWSQAVMSLNLVRKGGVVYLKMYTVCTEETTRLIDMMTLYFDKVYICKPYCSRVLNDESYIVGVGRNGESVSEISYQRVRCEAYKSKNIDLYSSFEKSRQQEKLYISSLVLRIIEKFKKIGFKEILSNKQYKLYYDGFKGIYDKIINLR